MPKSGYKPRGGFANSVARGVNAAVTAKNAVVKYKNAYNKGKNMAKEIIDLTNKLKKNRLGRKYKKVAGKAAGTYGGNPQYTRASYTMGQKKTFTQIMPTLVKANMNKFVLICRGLKAFDNNGFYKSYQQLDPTFITNTLPIWMFDLTTRDNPSNWNVPAPFKRMYIQTTGSEESKIRWSNQVGLDSLGQEIPSMPWQIRESPTGLGTATQRPATSQEFLEWSRIRIAAWGSRAKTTEFTIRLVQFTDPDLDPWEHNGVSSVKHQVFYQSMVKGLCFHPFSNHRNPHAKNMRVLKEIKHRIESNSSVEGDQDANVKLITLFNRWNRLLDYKQRGNVLAGEATLQDEVLTGGLANGGTPSQVADIQQGTLADMQVDSKKKIFLMITTTALTPGHVTFSAETDASFDLIVEKQISSVL